MTQQQNSAAFITRVVKAYPKEFCVLTGSFFLAGLAEALGITAVLPLITRIMGNSEASPHESSAQRLIDYLFNFFGAQQSVQNVLICIVSLIILRGALSLLAISWVGFITANITKDLRIRFIRALMNARWSYYKSVPVGKATNTISTDAERASLAVFSLGQISSDIFQISLYLFFSFMVSWKVTIAAVFSGLFLFYSLNSLIRWSRRAGTAQTELFNKLLSRLADAIGDIKFVKAMGHEEYFLTLLEDESNQLAKTRHQEILSGQIMSAIRDPIIAIMMGIGVYTLMEIGTTPFSVLMVLGLLYFRTVSRLAQLQGNLQKMAVFESAYWSIETAIKNAEFVAEENRGIAQVGNFTNITFQNVCFSHLCHVPLITDLNAEIPANQFTVIAGDSGSGKTTLIDLLSGLYTPQQGQIYIGNANIKDLDLHSWRKVIGYVPQDHNLLHESIFVNISLGNPNITRFDVETALRRAGADFIFSLPQGIDTCAEEKGGRFSGGQRQRISIARALVSNPRLLILDEPTSALDKDTEIELISTLLKLAETTTVVCVTHSHEVTKAAQNIIYL